ncbi:MAG: sigma 54-interacting transcriptional regulator [Myxococcaceae bacterium]
MTERARPDVTLTMPALTQDSAPKVRLHEWSVEVSSGPDKGCRVQTLDALIRVGTDTTSDLVLTDPTVSRRHAEIERTSRGFVVRDLGSRNGTFLESHQILQAFLQPGDHLQLGKTRLVLKQQPRPTDVEVEGPGVDHFGDLFGSSEAMRSVFAVLGRVARGQMNLLVEGETGTGKELAARAVHRHSPRRHGPFRVIDCSLLHGSAAERELQPPSPNALPPMIESAIGGTLFLDEICEIPPEVQPRLLRILESAADVRVIASSNRNVDEEVRRERLRKDIFFRVAVARVRMPSLRTRREELPALARHLMSHLGTQLEITDQTLALFEAYDWPGNVRELRNVLERGAVMQETGSTQWLEFLASPTGGGAPHEKTLHGVLLRLPYHDARDRVLGEFEHVYFAEVMKACGCDMKIAEERTGLSMQSLYRLLKKNGLRLRELKNADGL